MKGSGMRGSHPHLDTVVAHQWSSSRFMRSMVRFLSSKVIRQLPGTETLHSLWRAPESRWTSGRRVTDEALHGLGKSERGQDAAHALG